MSILEGYTMTSTRSADYLGDGLYVRLTGDMVELYTSNGLSELDHVFLEPEVLARFLEWVQQRIGVTR